MNEGLTIDDFLKDPSKAPLKPGRKLKKEAKSKKNFSKLRPGDRRKSRDAVTADETVELEFADGNPRSYGILTSVRIVFWVLLTVLVIRGIVAFAFPPRPIIQKVEYMQSPSESEDAKAFALQFTRDYLTYDDSSMEDYAKRLSGYGSKGITLERRTGWSEVLEANVFSLKKIDGECSIVTVYARIRQGKDDTGGIRDVYVRVPVFASFADGESNKILLAVRGYPIFSGPFENTGYDSAGYDDSSVTDSDRKDIEETLDNFFKIYDKGTAEQLSYFMKDAKKITGYNGEYTYQEIQSIGVLSLKQSGGEILVKAEITVTDINGSIFCQEFHFVMVRDKRWYIEAVVDVGKGY